MTEDQATLGVRVKSNMPFSGVPPGTEGVIDEFYPGGLMVAWDLPDQPLPEGYASYDGRPAIVSRILRDGFAVPSELQYLDVVNPVPEQEWIFTFGFGHVDPVTGISLRNSFCRVKGTIVSSREKMFERFGESWSMQYRTEDQAGVARHGLTEIFPWG